MKKLFHLVLVISFSPLSGYAQQDHFIYLQTENNVPFYIKADNKITSSSNAGYLILSKLKDGDYKMIIGSPKNEWPEQQLSYKVDRKDAGYLIKNFGDKGIGLFNLQTFKVLMSDNVVAATNKPVAQNNDDAFSNMLANVVNDSTIKQKDIIKEPEKPSAQPEKEIVITEDKEKKTTPAEPVKEAEVKPAATVAEPLLTSVIKRRLKKNGKEGTELVYTDEYQDKKDTIRIFIPADKTEVIKPDKPKPEEPKAVEKNIQETKIQEPKQELAANTKDQKDTLVEKKAEPIVSDTVAQLPDAPKKKVVTERKSIPQPVFIDDPKNEKVNTQGMTVNSDCKGSASEEDFFKLRKKMAAEKNDEAMVKVAKKVFNSKCFTTDQVKNLSNLFLKDKGRYTFFDAAYPYVTDTGMYSTLESQLTEPYYITRFKAMIHH